MPISPVDAPADAAPLAAPRNDNHTLTSLLDAWRQGDGKAFEKLIESAHSELKKMAAQRMRRENSSVTLATGDLLNEAVLNAMQAPNDFKNRAHFFATMSLNMRTILVAHARARRADKRGGDMLNITFTESEHSEEIISHDMLALDQALIDLEAVDARGSQVTQLAYFGGLSREQIAVVLEVSVATVDRELKFARAWIFDALKSDK
jgi:RNA polymerase sigma factor (TIGR02999 family)